MLNFSKIIFLSFRKYIWIICIAQLVVSVGQATASESHSSYSLSSHGISKKQFENKVKEFLDVPYRKGGTSKKGMDCSGFSRTIYAMLFGISLPHNSSRQYGSSEFRRVDDGKQQPGDLVFFANKKKKKINHVGVYISNRKFIHASSSQGIIVSSLDDSYWKKRFAGSKRHLALKENPIENVIRISSSQKKIIR